MAHENRRYRVQRKRGGQDFCIRDILGGDDLDFDTTRPRPDFVYRAEKELQKAANDLEQAARRGAPQAAIFNLQRKVEYKQYVLGLLKGR